jgi:hypothetical protein
MGRPRITQPCTPYRQVQDFNRVMRRKLREFQGKPVEDAFSEQERCADAFYTPSTLSHCLHCTAHAPLDMRNVNICIGGQAENNLGLPPHSLFLFLETPFWRNFAHILRSKSSGI